MNELLNAIDVINESVNDSELSVLESLISVYEKSLLILESSDDANITSYSIFQEGEILDQAKGNSSESLIKRILLFLPRLIKAIWQRLFKSSKATEKSMEQAVDATEQKKNNNEPCYFRIKLIIDPNNSVGEIPGTKHRMSRVIQYASEIETINQQTSQTQINNMVSGINNHGIEVLKTDIEDLKKAKSNMHTFTYTNWDDFEKALKWRQRHYGMTLAYDKQSLSDINDQIQDITKYTDSDPEFAKRVEQLVIAIKNLCKSYEEYILLWEECMNDDMKRINEALAIGQTNIPQQQTQPESGVGIKENNDQNTEVHRDVFEGGHWNRARLRQWAAKYKLQNPQECYIKNIKNGDNDQILFILSSNNKSIASISIDAGKVDKSLIPEEGKWIKVVYKDLKK